MSVDLFKNKYRIATTRLQGHDYSQNAWYFVTICTYERRHYFGEVVSKKMILNNMGQLVDVCWRELPKHFQYLKLDEYVVMPNHVHGFVHIDHVGGESEGHGDLAASVETRLIASLPRRTSTANSRVK